MAGREELVTSPQYRMITNVPQVKVVECIAGRNQQLCKTLRHNLHELMPPRLKIVAAQDQVYEYTSPLKREFVLRKLMKFTVPVAVIPFKGTEDLSQFDDVRIHGNVVFAARAGSEEAASKYRELAED